MSEQNLPLCDCGTLTHEHASTCAVHVPTPRADELKFRLYVGDTPAGWVVRVVHFQQLERELASAKAETAKAVAEFNKLHARLSSMIESAATHEMIYEAVCQQRDEARARADAAEKELAKLRGGA